MTKNEFLMELAVRIQKLTDRPKDIYEELKLMIKFYGEIIDDKIEDGMTEEEAVAAIESIDDIIARLKNELEEDAASAENFDNKDERTCEKIIENQDSCEYAEDIPHKIIIEDQNNAIIISRGEKVAVECCDSDEGNYDISNAGGVLRVKFIPKLRRFFRQFFSAGAVKRKPLVLAVPEGWDGILSAATCNGKIEAEADAGEMELRTSNAAINLISVAVHTLHAATSNGRIYAERVKCTGADMRTSNGKIEASDIAAGEYVKLETSNGTIEVGGIYSEDISLVTTNGAIKGSMPGSIADYAITSGTTNGRNNLPDGTKGEKKLNVRTSNGKIAIDFTE